MKVSNLKLILKNRVFAVFLIILVFNALVSVALLLYNNGPITLQLTNNLLPFNPPKIGWDVTVSSWLPDSFGFPSQGYNMGILFVFFAQSVFANAWTSQSILIFSPFCISSVTMILLLWFGNLTKSPLVLVCDS